MSNSDRHDLGTLYEQYPTIIAQMRPTFTSRQFILWLAQQNQVAYIEALYQYRNAIHRGRAAPFRALHSALAQGLSDYPDLVENIGQVDSRDIFGRPNRCAQWRKR